MGVRDLLANLLILQSEYVSESILERDQHCRKRVWSHFMGILTGYGIQCAGMNNAKQCFLIMADSAQVHEYFCAKGKVLF